MKTLTAAVFLVITLHHVAVGQTTLTLQQCYELARDHYPMIKQHALVQKTAAYSIENASKGRLPQISIGGQATYQSDVTRIPVEMPGVEPLSKDQYRIFGEVSQTLFHGGMVTARKQLEEASAAVETEQVEVDLYQVQNRVNDLFFGILLLQAQVTQTVLAREDLRAGLKKVEAAIDNGTALRSAADVLKAETLRLDQRIIGMQSTANAYREMLGMFINKEVGDRTVLEIPVFLEQKVNINRPELELFAAQRKVLAVNERLLSAAKQPRLDVFVQGGYGRPGLNMLDNNFDLYYVGGIRFSWQLSGYYTHRKEKQLLELRRQTVDVQEQTFEFNTNLALTQQRAEIERLQRLTEVDEEIISLRTRVRQTAEVQLAQGVITPTDFVREVNAEDNAKQDRALHQTQLMAAQAKYQYTMGQ